MMRRRNQGDGIDSSISHAPPNKKSQSPVAAKHQTRHASTKVSKIMSCFFLLTFNLALYVLVGTPQKDPYADKEAHTRRKTVVLDNNHFKISSRRDDFPSENDDFPSEFLPPVATKNIGHLTTLQEQNKTADVSDPFTSNWLDELGPEWENQECVPMHRWQLPKYGYANCNAIHEIDLMDPVTDLATVNCGSSRCAFRINQGGHQMVIKIAK